MTFRVTLVDRDGLAFPVEPGQSILAAAQAADVPLMSGCRTGACRTCAARLVQGTVHMPEGTSMDERLIAARVVLPCVATVRSDVELAVGPPGRTLLSARHLLPWTD